MREFLAAPQAVQDDFIRRLAKQVEAERDFDRYADELHDDDPTPPRTPATKLPRERLAWNETWSKRARLARRPRRKGGRDFEAERDALHAIETRTYFTALTGIDAGNGKVHCPLPDHDERTGSMHIYPADGGWYCFGCHRGGGIYDLAAALWGLATRGEDFKLLHDRLCELMGVRR